MTPDRTDDRVASASSGKKDFAALRASGERAGASKLIGSGFGTARDAVAAVLIKLGATPNRVTVAGFLFTCGAGVCLALGASQQAPFFQTSAGPSGWWPLAAAGFLFLAGGSDMLDGAVARLGRRMTRSGAVLDSSVDRLSDMAIFGGCFLHFALLAPPNLTYQVLALAALCNALLISYIKARAENIIDDCSVGYWLRGERFAAVLIGCTVGHVPVVLWQLSVSGAFTVWRRLTYAFFAIRADERGAPRPARGPAAGVRGRLQLWRHPRGSVPYDLVTAAHIAFIILGPVIWPVLLISDGGGVDPLRRWLAG